MKKNNMKKYIIIAMIIFAIINVIIGISLVFKESVSLKVNSENEAEITRILKQELDDVENIDKVELGMGFHSGELSIYYKGGKTFTFYGLEGMFNDESIEKYIRKNGTNLDDVAMIHFSISFAFIVLSIITKFIKTNKEL